MVDQMAGATDNFKKSFPLLVKFLGCWTNKIKSQCSDDAQRRAAWHIWGRYSLSVHTVYKICEAAYLPDLWLIGRSCLEHDAALQGVMASEKLAGDFLEFESKAKAYLGKIYGRLNSSANLQAIESAMTSIAGEQWRDHAAFKWCDISKVVEQHGGPQKRLLYASWSHFTHCSVLASLILDHIGPTQRNLDMTIGIIYVGYTRATYKFLDFIWGKIITLDSEQCKTAFRNVMTAATDVDS